MKEPLNLIICGVGGQGNVLIARLIGEALIKQDYFITVGDTYGVSQRGGAVTSHIRISKKQQYGPIIPEGKCDIIVGLEPLETLRVLGRYGNADTASITNTRPVYPQNVLAGEDEYPSPDKLEEAIKELSSKAWFINASDIALKLGAAIMTNVVMVGALLASDLMPISRKQFEEHLKISMSESKVKINLEALDKGFKAIKQKQNI